MPSRRKNIRVIILCAALLIGAAIIIAREHRPSFLRPGLRLNAYVTTQDGEVNVIDLVNFRSVARIPVGPALSGLREHPTRPEIWGVSTQDGYVFVLGCPLEPSHRAHSRWPSTVRSRILPRRQPRLHHLERQRSHYRDQCRNTRHRRPRADRHAIPSLPASLPTRRLSLSSITTTRRSAFTTPHPSRTSRHPCRHESRRCGDTPRHLARLRHQPQPSRDSPSSICDRNVLLANLQLVGTPSDMILKPDGGELYVISPESHGFRSSIPNRTKSATS